jgi:ABC-type transport system substrate-binding protein
VVRYLGFNMLDPVVGEDAGEPGRKLRQAMSLVIDVPEYLRVFRNGRGIPAHTPIPPGIFGHEEDYRNPFREVDLERAQTLLREAGYPGGLDPATGKPLQLTFDTPDTSSQARLNFLFFVNAWRELGIDVEISATNYNQFRQKVRNGAYQIFMWGWIADYPDPENFLFLLYSPMGQTKSGGPNTANFSNARYDALFTKMKDLPNGDERLALIREMITVLEEERPWIELNFDESYSLIHSWTQNVKPTGLSIPTLKYRNLDPALRAGLRVAWNEPIRWPAYALAFGFVAAIVPGVVTFFRERQ